MTRYGKTAVSTLALTLAAQGALAEGELNALVWCDRQAQKLAVPAGVHDEMRKFIRQNRQQQGAGGGAG